MGCWLRIASLRSTVSRAMAEQDDKPIRAEAIRRLITAGISKPEGSSCPDHRLAHEPTRTTAVTLHLTIRISNQ
jgi:hypothetical protein